MSRIFGRVWGAKEERRRDAGTEVFCLFDLLNSISRSKGSSEYCISHLLAPGAYARMPIVDRIEKLKIPITFACKLTFPLSSVVDSAYSLMLTDLFYILHE